MGVHHRRRHWGCQVGVAGVGRSSHGGTRGEGRVEVGPDGRAMTSHHKPWVGGGRGLVE